MYRTQSQHRTLIRIHDGQFAYGPKDSSSYRPPQLRRHGSLGPLIRGASWKGVDSVGELSPDQVSYPG